MARMLATIAAAVMTTAAWGKRNVPLAESCSVPVPAITEQRAAEQTAAVVPEMEEAEAVEQTAAAVPEMEEAEVMEQTAAVGPTLAAAEAVAMATAGGPPLSLAAALAATTVTRWDCYAGMPEISRLWALWIRGKSLEERRQDDSVAWARFCAALETAETKREDADGRGER